PSGGWRSLGPSPCYDALLVEVDDHLDDVPFRGGLEGHLVHQVLDEEDPPATRVALPLDLLVDVGRGDLPDPGALVLHGDLEAALGDRKTDADLHVGIHLVPMLDGVEAGLRDGGLQIFDAVGRKVHGFGHGGGEIHRDLLDAGSAREMQLEFLLSRHWRCSSRFKGRWWGSLDPRHNNGCIIVLLRAANKSRDVLEELVEKRWDVEVSTVADRIEKAVEAVEFALSVHRLHGAVRVEDDNVPFREAELCFLLV